MSIHRRAAKRDSNEAEIIAALIALGATVEQLSASGLPDLIIGINGVNVLAEVKAPKGKLTDAQVKWHEGWQGGVIFILRTIDDVENLWNEVMQS